MLHETGFDRYFTNGHISDSPKKQLLVKQQLIDKSSFINKKKTVGNSKQHFRKAEDTMKPPFITIIRTVWRVKLFIL